MELTLPETENETLALALQCHKGQKDKADCDYICHPAQIP